MAANIRNMLPSIPNALQYQLPTITNGLEMCPSISDIRNQFPTSINLKDMEWLTMPKNVWYRCPTTNKLEVCPKELLKVSVMIGGAVVVVGVAGYYVFPLLGFGSTGPVAKTFAASWHETQKLAFDLFLLNSLNCKQ